ncbi:hypothetical protein SAMN04489720_1286 [Agrococcus jejuensis]|uniref:Uncharacterized protein n=2 Tax=Agrococcus jejuensis TaxID=399736 RepID=A0A1G8CGR3_9MICO|nr:hypothetical protein SAMN04489720_1286 [Agrococcus jejuensis]
MRETSVGLGFIQVMMTVLLAALLVWLALAVGLVALVAWAIFHVVATQLHARRMREWSPAPMRQGPPPSPAYPDAALGGPPPSLAYAVPVHASVAPPRPPQQDGPSHALDPRGATNWVAVASIVPLVAAGLPLLLGQANWLTFVGGMVAGAAALVARRTSAGLSQATHLATMAVAVLSLVLIVVGGIHAWNARMVPLSAQPWGGQPGAMATVSELQVEIPCLDVPHSPGAQDGVFSVDTSGFVETVSCRISSDADAQPVLMVAASSPEALDAAFVDAVHVQSGESHTIWAARDGAVALITTDEASEDLANDVMSSWYSLRD